MAIFSLLLKPVSCYLVYQMYRERGGEYTFNIGRMLPLPPCQCGSPPLVIRRPPCTLDPSAWALCSWILPPFPGRGVALSLANVCSPILWFCCVLGLKFTFFLSSLADLESSSDSHFAHNGTESTAVSLFLSSSSCIYVCLLEAFGCPLLANPFCSFWGKVEAASPLAGLCTRGKEAGFLTPCCFWASHVPATLIALDLHFLTWKMRLMFTLWDFA